MGENGRPRPPPWRDALVAGGMACALLIAAAAAASATEIAPSQVTPESFAPAPLMRGSAPVVPSPGALPAPAGGETLRFRLGHLVVDGDYEEFAEDTAALARTAEGRTMSVADLFALASQIEQRYADHGYALVRVTIPPQKLSDGGEARLEVVDGFIESIQLDGVPEAARAAVSERVGGLIGRHRLKLPVLERAILLAGDLAGLRLRSALARGQTPGGTALVLEGEQRLVSVSAGFDNLLPPTLGRWEWNARLAVNNALGFGEQAYVSLASGFGMTQYGFPNAPLGSLGLGFSTPIGGDGWTLNPEVSRSITRLAAEPGVAASIGFLDRLALRSAYPLVRSRDQNLILNVALESVDQQLFIPLFGVDATHDAYGALRLGANWQGLLLGAAPLQWNAQFSQGLGGRYPRLGQTPPLSRQDTTPRFAKLNSDVHLDVPLPLASKLSLIERGQWSFARAQLVSEQFAMDGQDALSAFMQGGLGVDAGETLRGELSRAAAWPADGGAVLSPYVFAGQGYGMIYAPTYVEKSHIRATALGLGLRVAFDRPDGSGADVGAELSRGFSNAPGEATSSRAVLTVSLHN